MFAKAVHALFDQHRVRLETSFGLQATQAAFERLETQQLDPASIDAACAKELKSILSKRYEDPIASNRLQGHGWSTRHVHDHMRRFFEQKMQKAGQVLQSSVSRQDAAMASTLSMLEL